jgi:hypothetical protein
MPALAFGFHLIVLRGEFRMYARIVAELSF